MANFHGGIGPDGEPLNRAFTAEEEAALTVKRAERVARISANGYKKVRRNNYGSIEDQLDMIYWDQVNDTTIWKDAVAAVKAAHPKPG